MTYKNLDDPRFDDAGNVVQTITTKDGHEISDHNAEGDPLKGIVKVVTKSPTYDGADYVELECGHRGYTLGTELAGCPHCKRVESDTITPDRHDGR